MELSSAAMTGDDAQVFWSVRMAACWRCIHGLVMGWHPDCDGQPTVIIDSVQQRFLLALLTTSCCREVIETRIQYLKTHRPVLRTATTTNRY